MKLHVFNPEHDIVMAYGDGMFTSPHAARGLRRDLGFIPAFTAEDGDFVLVDDKVTSEVVKKIADLDDIIEAKYIRI